MLSVPAQRGVGWRAGLRALFTVPPRDAAVLVGAFVASRVVVLVAAIVAEALLPRNAALTSGDGATPILRSLTAWDGWWYTGIAQHGYHAAPLTGAYHDYAFLPLFPAIVGVLSLPWPGLAGLIGVLVANVAFAVALVLLYRLGEPIVGARRAALAAGLLAVFPFGAAFAMAYAESLFLALSVAAFLAAQRDRRALAGVLLLLAALTRLQGAILVVPMILLLLQRDGWRPRASQAWPLLGLAGAALFFVYVAALTGDPGAYGAAQVAWGRGGAGSQAPGGTLGSGIASAGGTSPVLVTLLVVLLASVFLLVYMRPDRIPGPYILIPILYLGAVFASGLLESVGRYAMLAFPYAWVLANRRTPAFRTAWPLISAGLLGILSLLEFGGYFVP